MNNLSKVKCSVSNIEYIIHLSDIHVRNLRRHDEYNEQFQKTYVQIQNILDLHPNTIICVTGDIVHSKVEMSPELVEIVSKFFTNLSKLAFTIITPGNHDANLNNGSRLDALSPIIDNLSNKDNLVYLKKSGLYQVSNLIINNMSPLDSVSKYFRVGSKFQEKYVVGIYHGPVNNSKTDTGVLFKNNFNLDIFDGCDIVLLGDIHVRQRLQSFQIYNSVVKKPTVDYAGSLIQQNYGESINNHGILLWNLKNRDNEFYEIPNEYFFDTLYFENNNSVTFNPKLNKKSRVRIKYSNCDKEFIEIQIQELKQSFGVTDISILNINNTIFDSVPKNLDTYESLFIKNVGDQNKAIIQFFKDDGRNIDSDLLNSILNYNTELNNRIQGNKEYDQNKRWVPVKFEFSNMFCYGEDNYIDFTDLTGILGIFAGNATGKSSLVDALCFCLFDKSPRTYKADKILNTNKDYFHCKFHFRVDGENYFIEKVGTKYSKIGTPTKVKVDINFWKEPESGEKISLNGDERFDTRSIIQEYIGTYEDFINTNLSFQGSSSNFIESSQTERKDMLSRFLDLQIFDLLYKEANKDKGLVDFELESINNNPSLDLESLNVQKIKLEILLRELEQKILVGEKELFANEQKVLDCTKQIQNIKKYNYSELISNKNDLETEISKLRVDASIHNTELQDIINSQKLLYEKSKLLNTVAIENGLVNLQKYKTELVNIESNIKLLNQSLNEKYKTIEKLHNHKYDPNCAFCMSNPFVIDALQVSGSIESNVSKLEGLSRTKDMLIVSISSSQQFETMDAEYKQINSDLNECNTKIKYYNLQIELNSKLLKEKNKLLKTVINDIKDYEKNILLEKQNVELEKMIVQYSSNIKQFKEQLKEFGKLKIEYSTKLQVISSEIKRVSEILDRRSELYSKSKYLNIYLSIVDRDGLPSYMISKYLPILENEVDNVLSNLVNFKLLFNMDGKNINSYIVYDDDKFWPLELSSGMERFISSIAIRASLYNISMLPKTNFFIIDEGMGVLDSTNLNSIYLLFNYMRDVFKFVFVISHLDGIKDMVDDNILLSTQNGYSKLTI